MHNNDLVKSSVSFSAWIIILPARADNSSALFFIPCTTLKSGTVKLSVSTIRIAGGISNKYMTMNSYTISRIDGEFIIKSTSISEG